LYGTIPLDNLLALDIPNGDPWYELIPSPADSIIFFSFNWWKKDGKTKFLVLKFNIL
jgi:hypothetical protein